MHAKEAFRNPSLAPYGKYKRLILLTVRAQGPGLSVKAL